MERPGPKSQALLERRKKVVARGTSHATPLFAEHALGVRIKDVDGMEYIDFAGGIGVQNLGHRPDAVVEALQRQLAAYLHTSWNVVMYEPYVEVCERLVRLAPGSGEKRALLVNSGAEAVENAVKIARAYTRRPAVVAFRFGFHGRTLLTMALTGKTEPYRAGFGPFPPEIYHVPYPYPYRDPQGTDPDFARISADRLLSLFETEVAAAEVAAVIVEPVAGEGGFIVPPRGFLSRLRSITEEHGILLIADEIQTGFGRTGKLFAVEHEGVTPDLMTVGKSLAAGLPLAGVVGRAEVMDAPGVGQLGGTYGGNPLACAAANAVLASFEQDAGILARARKVGERVEQTFLAWKERFPIIGDVRSLGPMAALELISDPKTRKEGADEARAVADYAWQHGLLLMRAGMKGHVIRTLMPVVIDEKDLAEGLSILEDALGCASAL